jgi:radical SAM superfamily enzyme YgiQ (UPF0313 family)
MRILFINAIDASKSIETVYPHLGLAYLSAVLKQRFPEIKIGIVDRDFQSAILAFHPDAVGVSCVSQNYGIAVEIGRYCKQKGITVFIGGIHISLLPSSLSTMFDFGVYGEGEDTIVEIVQYLRDGGLSGGTEMGRIAGLIVHVDGKVKLTAERPVRQDLDSIPFPDRSLLHIPSGGTTYLFTSRGCPYKCTFCASTQFWNKVRWFSAEYVVNEIEYVVEHYKPWAISFYDDLFTANIKRLSRIVELLCAKGLDKKVKFGFACRANLVNERLIELLRPLKISMICMGLESGCQRTLEFLKGPGITVAQNRKAVELLAGANINVQGTFVIGSPDETEDEIIQTLDFIKRSKLTNFEVYVLSPFPGTRIWDMAMSMGLVANEMNWADLAIDSGSTSASRIVLSTLPRSRLAELHAMFFYEQKRRRLLYLLRTAITSPRWTLAKMKKYSLIAAGRLRSATVAALRR